MLLRANKANYQVKCCDGDQDAYIEHKCQVMRLIEIVRLWLWYSRREVMYGEAKSKVRCEYIGLGQAKLESHDACPDTVF